MDICGEFPVIYNGTEYGKAKVEREGIRFKISAQISEFYADKPFRLGAPTNGGTVSLGVMLPSGEQYVFSRVYSSNELKALGIFEISDFTLIKADESENAIKAAPQPLTAEESGWEESDEPSMYIAEGEFRRAFSECKKALIRREGEITYIAVPVVKGEEFPVMQLFCLGEAWKIGGKLHLVFKVREEKLIF